jgi:hypothetical protein
MELRRDNPVFPLYLLARGGDEPMINDVQKEAIRMLSDLSAQGNKDAQESLIKLWHVPNYHILLREMVGATLGIMTPSRS